MVDDSHLWYQRHNYNFTQDEFMILFDYLEKNYEDQHDDCTNMFYELKLYLEYKGEKYVWRVLSGQGTACQILFVNKENEEWFKENGDELWKEDKKITLPENLNYILEPKYRELTIKEIIT